MRHVSADITRLMENISLLYYVNLRNKNLSLVKLKPEKGNTSGCR